MRRKMADRRVRPRFDIVGDLWGTLETVLRLPVRNVSRGGAMIHSHVPLPPQIILFLENLWDFSESDEEIFLDEVHTTLLHELGHYLGLGEDDLEERGLE